MLKTLTIALVVILPLVVLAKPLSTSELEIVEKPLNIRVYAFQQILDKWGDDQWIYFNDLIQRESNWRNEAQNPKSSAFGLAQFLNSTWQTVGCEKTTDKFIQIDCAIKYVEKVYKTPEMAIKFHNKKGWY